MTGKCRGTAGRNPAVLLGLLCLLLSASLVCGGDPVLTHILHRWRLDGNTLDSAGSQALSWDSGTADPVPAAYEGLQRNSLAAASLTQTGHLVVDLNPDGPTYDRGAVTFRDVTIMSWVKLTTVEAGRDEGVLWEFYNDRMQHRFSAPRLVVSRSGGATLQVRLMSDSSDPDTLKTTSVAAWPSGWVHVAVTMQDYQKAKLYVYDAAGASVVMTESAAPTGSWFDNDAEYFPSSLRIGCRTCSSTTVPSQGCFPGEPSGNGVEGLFQELRIYQKALSANQIALERESDVPRIISFTAHNTQPSGATDRFGYAAADTMQLVFDVGTDSSGAELPADVLDFSVDVGKTTGQWSSDQRTYVITVVDTDNAHKNTEIQSEGRRCEQDDTGHCIESLIHRLRTTVKKDLAGRAVPKSATLSVSQSEVLEPLQGFGPFTGVAVGTAGQCTLDCVGNPVIHGDVVDVTAASNTGSAPALHDYDALAVHADGTLFHVVNRDWYSAGTTAAEKGAAVTQLFVVPDALDSANPAEHDFTNKVFMPNGDHVPFTSIGGIAVSQDKTLFLASSDRHLIYMLSQYVSRIPSDASGKGVAMPGVYDQLVTGHDGTALSTTALSDNWYVKGRYGAVENDPGDVVGVRGFADGTASDARFNTPVGVAVHEDGTVYVADRDNNAIRTIGFDLEAREEVVKTLATDIHQPTGLAVHQDRTVYVCSSVSDVVTVVGPDGTVSVLAGMAFNSGDQSGFGTAAMFHGPSRLQVHADHTVYVADTYNNKVKRIAPDGYVDTVAGSGSVGAVDDKGVQASLNNPVDIGLTQRHVLFVADKGNNKLRKVTMMNVSYPSGKGSGVIGFHSAYYDEDFYAAYRMEKVDNGVGWDYETVVRVVREGDTSRSTAVRFSVHATKGGTALAADVTHQRSPAANGDKEMADYRSADLFNTNGNSTAPSVLWFAVGVTEMSYKVMIYKDAGTHTHAYEFEPETITMQLHDPQEGSFLGSTAEAAIVVRDCTCSVSFVSSGYFGREEEYSTTVDVRRSGCLERQVTVGVRLKRGAEVAYTDRRSPAYLFQADLDLDFDITDGSPVHASPSSNNRGHQDTFVTLTFDADDDEETFIVWFRHDSEIEPEETFELELHGPTNAHLGPLSWTNVTLLDCCSFVNTDFDGVDRAYEFNTQVPFMGGRAFGDAASSWADYPLLDHLPSLQNWTVVGPAVDSTYNSPALCASNDDCPSLNDHMDNLTHGGRCTSAISEVGGVGRLDNSGAGSRCRGMLVDPAVLKNYGRENRSWEWSERSTDADGGVNDAYTATDGTSNKFVSDTDMRAHYYREDFQASSSMALTGAHWYMASGDASCLPWHFRSSGMFQGGGFDGLSHSWPVNHMWRALHGFISWDYVVTETCLKTYCEFFELDQSKGEGDIVITAFDYNGDYGSNGLVKKLTKRIDKTRIHAFHGIVQFNETIEPASVSSEPVDYQWKNEYGEDATEAHVLDVLRHVEFVDIRGGFFRSRKELHCDGNPAYRDAETQFLRDYQPYWSSEKIGIDNVRIGRPRAKPVLEGCWTGKAGSNAVGRHFCLRFGSEKDTPRQMRGAIKLADGTWHTLTGVTNADGYILAATSSQRWTADSLEAGHAKDVRLTLTGPNSLSGLLTLKGPGTPPADILANSELADEEYERVVGGCDGAAESCGGNGWCSSGTCACFPGYTGAACTALAWTVSKITPTAGRVAGGTDVRIHLSTDALPGVSPAAAFTHTYFECVFGDTTERITATAVSATEISCVSPARVSSSQSSVTLRIAAYGNEYDVGLAWPRRHPTVVYAGYFHYFEITNIRPSSGPIGGTTPITIVGRNMHALASLENNYMCTMDDTIPLSRRDAVHTAMNSESNDHRHKQQDYIVCSANLRYTATPGASDGVGGLIMDTYAQGYHVVQVTSHKGTNTASSAASDTHCAKNYQEQVPETSPVDRAECVFTPGAQLEPGSGKAFANMPIAAKSTLAAYNLDHFAFLPLIAYHPAPDHTIWADHYQTRSDLPRVLKIKYEQVTPSSPSPDAGTATTPLLDTGEILCQFENLAQSYGSLQVRGEYYDSEYVHCPVPAWPPGTPTEHGSLMYMAQIAPLEVKVALNGEDWVKVAFKTNCGVGGFATGASTSGVSTACDATQSLTGCCTDSGNRRDYLLVHPPSIINGFRPSRAFTDRSAHEKPTNVVVYGYFDFLNKYTGEFSCQFSTPTDFLERATSPFTRISSTEGTCDALRPFTDAGSLAVSIVDSTLTYTDKSAYLEVLDAPTTAEEIPILNSIYPMSGFENTPVRFRGSGMIPIQGGTGAGVQGATNKDSATASSQAELSTLQCQFSEKSVQSGSDTGVEFTSCASGRKACQDKHRVVGHYESPQSVLCMAPAVAANQYHDQFKKRQLPKTGSAVAWRSKSSRPADRVEKDNAAKWKGDTDFDDCSLGDAAHCTAVGGDKHWLDVRFGTPVRVTSLEIKGKGGTLVQVDMMDTSHKYHYAVATADASIFGGSTGANNGGTSCTFCEASPTPYCVVGVRLHFSGAAAAATVVLEGYPCNGHPQLEECVAHRDESSGAVNTAAKLHYNPHDHVELERWGYYYSYLRKAMMSTYCLAEEGDDCSCAPITIAGRPYWVRARGEIFSAAPGDNHDTLSAKMLKRFGFNGGVSTGPDDALGSTTGPKLSDICNWYSVGYETGTKFPNTDGVLNGLQECSAFDRHGYYYWGKQDLLLSAFCVPGEDDCSCASVKDDVSFGAVGKSFWHRSSGRDPVCPQIWDSYPRVCQSTNTVANQDEDTFPGDDGCTSGEPQAGARGSASICAEVTASAGGVGYGSSGGGNWLATDKSASCHNFFYQEMWSFQPMSGPKDQEFVLTITGKNFLPDVTPGGESDWAGLKSVPQSITDPAGPDQMLRSYVCRFTSTVGGAVYIKKTPATRLDDSTLICTRPKNFVAAAHTASDGTVVGAALTTETVPLTVAFDISTDGGVTWSSSASTPNSLGSTDGAYGGTTMNGFFFTNSTGSSVLMGASHIPVTNNGNKLFLFDWATVDPLDAAQTFYVPSHGGTLLLLRMFDNTAAPGTPLHSPCVANDGSSAVCHAMKYMCKFGNVVREAEGIAANGIYCRTPPKHLAGAYELYMQVSPNGDGQGVIFTTTQRALLKYYEVRTISPSTSYKTGGDTVVVYGHNFDLSAAMNCIFGKISVKADLVRSNARLGVDEVVCRVPALSEHGVDVYWESGLVPVEVEIPGGGNGVLVADATYQKKSEFVTANNVRIRYYEDVCSECPGQTMCAVTCPYNWTIQSLNRAEYGSVHCHNRPTCSHYGAQSWWQRSTTGALGKTITAISDHSGKARVTASHSFVNDDIVLITGVTGMWQVNGQRYKVSDATASNFKLKSTEGSFPYISCAGYKTYISGGTVSKATTFTDFAQPLLARSENDMADPTIHMDHDSDIALAQSRMATARIHTATWFPANFTGGEWARTAITGISKDDPAVVSALGHQFVTGDRVTISGVQGMTEVNGRSYTVLGAGSSGAYDADEIKLQDTAYPSPADINSNSYATYTSGGTLSRVHSWGGSDNTLFFADGTNTYTSVYVPGSLTQNAAPQRLYEAQRGHEVLVGDGNMSFFESVVASVENTTTMHNAIQDSWHSVISLPSDPNVLRSTDLSDPDLKGTFPITAVTGTTTTTITAVGHTFADSDRVMIKGVLGMVELNNNLYTVASVSGDTFQIKTTADTPANINKNSYTAYTSGGIAQKEFTRSVVWQPTVVKHCVFHPDQVCTIDDTTELAIVDDTTTPALRASPFLVNSPSYGNKQALRVSYKAPSGGCTGACLTGHDPGLVQNVYVEPNRRYTFEVIGRKASGAKNAYLYVRDITTVESHPEGTMPVDESRTDQSWSADPEHYCDPATGCILPGRDVVCRKSDGPHCVGTQFLPQAEWTPVSVTFVTSNRTTRLQVGVRMDTSAGEPAVGDGTTTYAEQFFIRAANLRLRSRDFNMVNNPSFETPGLDKTGQRCQMGTYPQDCVTLGTTLVTTTLTAVEWTLTAYEVLVTGITSATPPVVSTAVHTLVAGQRVRLMGVGGMWEVNGNMYTVGTVAGNNFALKDTAASPADVVGGGYTAYTSGGLAQAQYTGISSNDLGRPGQPAGYQGSGGTLSSATPDGTQVLYLAHVGEAAQAIAGMVAGKQYQVSWLEAGSATVTVSMDSTVLDRGHSSTNTNCANQDCRLEEDLHDSTFSLDSNVWRRRYAQLFLATATTHTLTLSVMSDTGIVLVDQVVVEVVDDMALYFETGDKWAMKESKQHLPQSGPYTMECWAKTFSDAQQILLGWGADVDADDDAVKLVINTGGVAGTLSNSWKVAETTGVSFASGASFIGSWHHFLAVYDDTNGNGILYMDGVSRATASLGTLALTPSRESNTLWLGQMFGTETATQFKGAIDEVRVWQRALTAQQVWAVYKMPSESLQLQEMFLSDRTKVTCDQLHTCTSCLASLRCGWCETTKACHHNGTGTTNQAVITGAAFSSSLLTVTADQHPFVDGDKIRIAGVAGMTELNGITYTVSASVSQTSFVLQDTAATPANVNGATFTSYTSGGIATAYKSGGGATYETPACKQGEFYRDTGTCPATRGNKEGLIVALNFNDPYPKSTDNLVTPFQRPTAATVTALNSHIARRRVLSFAHVARPRLASNVAELRLHPINNQMRKGVGVTCDSVEPACKGHHSCRVPMDPKQCVNSASWLQMDSNLVAGRSGDWCPIQYRSDAVVSVRCG